MTRDAQYDVLVIGGGPAGATAALTLARRGFRVVVLERDRHPRFHIGESFLPRNYKLLCDLGLRQRLEAIPQTFKPGAEFGMGHGKDPSSRFRFTEMLGTHEHRAFNIERAPFDAMLFEAARDAGADMCEDTAVKRIVKLSDGDVVVQTATGELSAKFLIDASGQTAVVGKHLKTRRVLQQHQKVAYFGHFQNVERLEGDEAGSPGFAMCREGWFWMIPLDETRTGVGVVMDAEAARSVAVPADQMLRWAIERCPMVRSRTNHAVFPQRNGVCADFSYRCDPSAGEGYFLVGDAAAFIDPIFSTGVCMGMMSAIEACDGIEAILRSGKDPARVRRSYIRFVKHSSLWFFRMIDLYYKHEFRELFLHGEGPLQMRQAVITLLAGNVFPRPAWSVRWRLRLFEAFVKLQRWVPLAPRREDFSLLDAPAVASSPETCNKPQAQPACSPATSQSLKESTHDSACV